VEVVWTKVANSDTTRGDVHTDLVEADEEPVGPMLDAGLAALVEDGPARAPEGDARGGGRRVRRSPQGASDMGNGNSDDAATTCRTATRP